MSTRAHVFISGKVQGVFFRSGTRSVAIELGIKGWVRNREDGMVEAVFEGEKEIIEEMIKWCRKGPEMADVSDVEVAWEEYTNEFTGFDVRH